MSITPKLTVVITSYGYGHLIAQAIDSVLSQTIMPDKIIVVDDGAHDGACNVAERYGLVCIEREKNRGIIRNYNSILSNFVRTEKVMFLAADDWIRPDYIEKMNLDYDIVSSDVFMVGEYASVMRQSMKKDIVNGYYVWRFYPEKSSIFRTNFIHGSSIYNAELAKKVGGYESVGSNKVKRLQEDWGLFRKMIKAGATHSHIKEPMLFYRKHRFNINGVY